MPKLVNALPVLIILFGSCAKKYDSAPAQTVTASLTFDPSDSTDGYANQLNQTGSISINQQAFSTGYRIGFTVAMGYTSAIPYNANPQALSFTMTAYTQPYPSIISAPTSLTYVVPQGSTQILGEATGLFTQASVNNLVGSWYGYPNSINAFYYQDSSSYYKISFTKIYKRNLSTGSVTYADGTYDILFLGGYYYPYVEQNTSNPKYARTSSIRFYGNFAGVEITE